MRKKANLSLQHDYITGVIFYYTILRSVFYTGFLTGGFSFSFKN
jgi:hypothetical protein